MLFESQLQSFLTFISHVVQDVKRRHHNSFTWNYLLCFWIISFLLHLHFHSFFVFLTIYRPCFVAYFKTGIQLSYVIDHSEHLFLD